MSYNGSGTFLINTAGQPVVSGTVISSTAFNALTADLATGLSTAITKDGQTTVTANIPMSTYKFTGLGVGSAATDSANLSQVQSTVTKLLNSVSGADTITATASPTLAAYAAGQMFYFVAAGDNTTSVTLNIDSLGAKAVTRDGATALAASDIKSGEVVVVVYDGTRFQVVSQLNSAGDARFANVSIASSLYVGGVSTFVGNAGFSANVSITSALSVGGVAAITGATTIGGNLTLSGGTANGVLYLNGSKVATSGSALVFDGSNLGVGGSPGYRIDVTGGTSSFAPSNSVGAIRAQNNSTTSLELHVRPAAGKNGFISFTEDTVADRWVMGVLGGSAGLLWGTGNPGSYSEQMRLTSTGLGIGTASPATKLSITNDSAATNSAVDVLTLTQTSSGTAASGLGPGVKFMSERPDGIVLNRAGIYGVAGSAADDDGDMTFWTLTTTAPGGFTEKMRLDSSGNLGIGTASPGKNLEVAAATDTTIRIRNTTANLSSAVYGTLDWATSDSSAPGGIVAKIDTFDDFPGGGGFGDRAALRFFTNNATALAERARIDSSGNLLVGSTNNSATVGAGIKSLPAYNGVNGPQFAIVTSASTNTTSSLAIYSTGAAAYRFYVADNGQIYATNTTITGISDRRLKENIRDLDAGLDAIMALKPRKFDWKEGKGKDIKNDRGFIAQEFEQVFPDLIDEWKDPAPEGEEPYKAVRADLIPVLVKAMQEQQAMIETLKAEVAALKGA